MIYYISDLHFGHYNIIKLCHRPFKDADEMDEILISNWNAIVQPEDTVYILGDLCYRNGKPPEYYLERLNGRKYLILGNHDTDLAKNRRSGRFPQLEWIRDYAEISDGNRKLVLSHYPMVEWNGFFRDTIHLYGHIHNNTENAAYHIMKDIKNAYNVGADILGFTPRTLDQVIRMNKKFREKQNTRLG